MSRLSEDDVPVGLVFVAMATLALLSPAQPDTWTHLRAGREMWTTGELITIERFSFTSAGVPWHNTSGSLRCSSTACTRLVDLNS